MWSPELGTLKLHPINDIHCHFVLVMNTGNPQAKLELPMPAQTHTHRYGCGFPTKMGKGVNGQMDTHGSVDPPACLPILQSDIQ